MDVIRKFATQHMVSSFLLNPRSSIPPSNLSIDTLSITPYKSPSPPSQPNSPLLNLTLSNSPQGTKDVRLDPQLNKKMWECGIKGVPHKIRVRISRKRNDEEDARERLYSYVQAVNVENPKGLQTVVVEDA